MPDGVEEKIRSSWPEIEIEAAAMEAKLLWDKVEVPQTELLRLLEELISLGLSIRSVGRREATLEEVFVRLTNNEGEKT